MLPTILGEPEKTIDEAVGFLRANKPSNPGEFDIKSCNRRKNVVSGKCSCNVSEKKMRGFFGLIIVLTCSCSPDILYIHVYTLDDYLFK